MKIVFYLQYFSYEDENFAVNEEYYKDSNDYIKQLEESYNSTKDTIFEMMSSGNYINNNSKDSYKMTLSSDYNKDVKEDKVSYCSCEGKLFNEKMEEMNNREIGICCIFQDVLIGKIELKQDSCEEEFETNWRMFIDSTKKINEYDADDEWKFSHRPSKDIFMTVEDDNGKVEYIKLSNCRIEENIEFSKNILIIEKMEYIDNFLN